MEESAFQELYPGELWVDPDEQVFIQVTDMDSAAGETGVTLLEKGTGRISDEYVQRGLEMNGLFTVERPPARILRKGRKAWDPAPRSGRDPAPQSGQLFWTPKEPEGYRIMDTWLAFVEAEEPFATLPVEAQDDVLRALESAFSYGHFDGRPDDEVVVLDKNTDAVTIDKDGKEVTERRWGEFPVITDNPTAAIWETLVDWGVEKPDAD